MRFMCWNAVYSTYILSTSHLRVAFLHLSAWSTSTNLPQPIETEW